MGSEMCIRDRGYSVSTLKRSKVLEANEFFWDPSRGEIDKLALKGIDVVVHLAGEPIAQRWSSSAKKVSLIVALMVLVYLQKQLLSRRSFLASFVPQAQIITEINMRELPMKVARRV